MTIKILVITYNRPEYANKTLMRLCDTAPSNLRLTIWDNGSNKATKEVVDKFRNHWCVERIIFNESNEKLRGPTNWFWENSMDADLLGKVDDDCLVPKNWCSLLEQAHKDIPRAGILGCWHFLAEDIVTEIAIKKIHKFSKHKIMRNCWVGGSGYLMKKAVLNKIGYLEKNESFTDYCIRAAAKGFINGWYYPLLFLEHMDDPRSKHSGIKNDVDFQRLAPLSAKTFNIQTRDQWIQRLRWSAKRLQEYSIDPSDYIGIKPKIMRRILKILGREYFPRIGSRL